MMFDRLDTDAEFGGDLLVSPTMHAVHHEDTSGLGRHGTNHPPIEVEHVHRLDPQSLIGAGRAIAPEKETVGRSEEHTSELQSLMRISYAVFCLKKKKKKKKKANDTRLEKIKQRIVMCTQN